MPEELKEAYFIPIPDNFKKDFDVDPVNSLKDIAGISLHSQGKFFTDKISFQNCIKGTMRHPFNKEFLTVSTNYKGNEFIEALKDDFYGDNSFEYYVHNDLAKNGDSGGMAMGHLDRFMCVVDFMILVNPPDKPHQIDIDKFEQFIIYLRDVRKFRIKVVTADGWQSLHLIQYFNKKNIKSFEYSVDRKDSPYMLLREKILTEKVFFYDYYRFYSELFNLEHDRVKNKVDHPPQNGKFPKDGGHGKDISDAVCAIVNHAFDFGFVNSEISESIRSKILANIHDKHKDLYDNGILKKTDDIQKLLEYENKRRNFRR
jgi:hypothetical protein